MASFVSSLTSGIPSIMSSVLDNFEYFHCVVAAVCVAGVLMAVWSDEEHTQKYAQRVLKSSNNVKKEKPLSADETLFLQSPSLLQSMFLVVTDIHRALQKGHIFERAWDTIVGWVKFLQFLRSARALKNAAKSRRQFYYMLEKQLLDLDIDQNESEIKSYLDVKRHLGDNWPFMWKVAEVKEDKIDCEGYACVPMSSYSYLDLMRCSEVQESAILAARQWSTGNHGPRMLGGNMTILVDLEKKIAEFFGRDNTLLCAAGFLACMSVVCAVAHEGDVVFADARVHASLRSGLKLCGAKVLNFKHNDYAHCEKLMKKHRKKFNGCWLVIESVFSMDGDIADLPAAHALCRRFDAKMILDEAHGLGVLGKTGRGLEEHFNLPGAATLICGTFSKSIASIGGYICGSKDMVDFMDFHAPGNVFSAPLPAYCAGAALKSFELIDRESWRVSKAQENSKFLRKCLETGNNRWPVDYPEEWKYELEGDVVTTVIPVVFPDDIDRVMRIASLLKRRGYMVSAVAFPACPLRRPRFRVTSTSAYDHTLIEEFVNALVDAAVHEQPSESCEQLKQLSLM